MIDILKVIDTANKRYKENRRRPGGIGSMSKQVAVMTQVICEEINKALESLRDDFDTATIDGWDR